jgi:hypothetical protein
VVKRHINKEICTVSVASESLMRKSDLFIVLKTTTKNLGAVSPGVKR